VHVGEDHPGPLVGRKPPGEADRQDVRVEDPLELLEHARCLAVPGELRPQPAAGKQRELELLAHVRLPELVVGDLVEAIPPAAPVVTPVEIVEVRVEITLEQVAKRAAEPSRRVDPVRYYVDRRRDYGFAASVRRLG